MNTRIRDFAIGLTALAGLVGLAATLFLVGELRIAPTYPLRFAVDSAAGLSEVSPVTLNGVRIGSVTRIRPADDPRDGVVIDIRVDQSVSVPRAIRVGVDRTLVGDASLSLRTLAADGPLDPLQPGEVIRAEVATILNEIGALLDERLGSLDEAAASFRRLSDTYVRVGERVELMLEPRSIADVDAGLADPNVATAVSRVDRAARDLNVWLEDDQLRDDAKRAVTRAASLFDQAAEAVEAWTDAGETVASRADQIGSSADRIAGDLSRMSSSLSLAIEDIRAVSLKVNEGEGTIGLLVNNPDLYNALTDASRRLEKALLEAQLLVEKYRKEGIPINW